MTRRLGGILGLVIAISLALALIWRVYIHHRRADHRDEPAVVLLDISGDLVKSSSDLS